MAADLNWDSYITFDEFVQNHLEWQTNWFDVVGNYLPVDISTFAPDISKSRSELLDYNADGFVTLEEYWAYTAYEHLWTNMTTDMTTTDLEDAPEWVPQIYWDFMDMNLDCFVSEDEFF